MVRVLSEEKIHKLYKVNPPQNFNFTQNDIWWLYSRGGLTLEDCNVDEFGRKFLKDYRMPISGEWHDKKWGRDYLPTEYSKYAPHTSGLKLDTKTNKLYCPW